MRALWRTRYEWVVANTVAPKRRKIRRIEVLFYWKEERVVSSHREMSDA